MNSNNKHFAKFACAIGALFIGAMLAGSPTPPSSRAAEAQTAEPAKKPALEYGTREYLDTIGDAISTDLLIIAENSFECVKPARDCNFSLAISKFDRIIAKRKDLYVPACLVELDRKIGKTFGALYAGIKFTNDGLNGGSNERLRLGLASMTVGRDYMHEAAEVVNTKEKVQALLAGCVVKS